MIGLERRWRLSVGIGEGGRDADVDHENHRCYLFAT
jgi:hypothetical protein